MTCDHDQHKDCQHNNEHHHRTTAAIASATEKLHDWRNDHRSNGGKDCGGGGKKEEDCSAQGQKKEEGKSVSASPCGTCGAGGVHKGSEPCFHYALSASFSPGGIISIPIHQQYQLLTTLVPSLINVGGHGQVKYYGCGCSGGGGGGEKVVVCSPNVLPVEVVNQVYTMQGGHSVSLVPFFLGATQPTHHHVQRGCICGGVHSVPLIPLQPTTPPTPAHSHGQCHTLQHAPPNFVVCTCGCGRPVWASAKL
ncbi:hypothetical protein JCM8547_008469 [Rhodosporidiobolus lusitaniae]